MSSQMIENILSNLDKAQSALDDYLTPHIRPFILLQKELGNAHGDIENDFFRYEDHTSSHVTIIHVGSYEWNTHIFHIPLRYFENPLLYAEAERDHLNVLKEQRKEQDKKNAESKVTRLRRELAEAEAALDNSQKAN